MRRMAWWGTTAGLAVLLLCGSAVADKDTYQPPEPANKKHWWWPWGGSAKKEDTRKTDKPTAKSEPAEKPPKVKDPVEAPMPAATSVARENAASMSREQAKFIRRQQVCDRIREAAQETNNTELEKQAQLLEQRAWYLYEQRTVQARMPSLQPLESAQAAKKLMNDEPSSRRRADDSSVRTVNAKNDTRIREE
jgi:hypothetical protein